MHICFLDMILPALNPLVLFILYHPCESIGIALLCFVFGMLLWIPSTMGGTCQFGNLMKQFAESLSVLGVIQGSQPCADLPNPKLEGHPNDRGITITMDFFWSFALTMCISAESQR